MGTLLPTPAGPCLQDEFRMTSSPGSHLLNAIFSGSSRRRHAVGHFCRLVHACTDDAARPMQRPCRKQICGAVSCHDTSFCDTAATPCIWDTRAVWKADTKREESVQSSISNSWAALSAYSPSYAGGDLTTLYTIHGELHW